MNTIGQRIRTLRKAREWSQEQLAGAAGITPQAISDLETGKTANSAYLPEIARALNSTAEYLRYGDQVRDSAPTYQADLDKITEIFVTGRLEPKEVQAIRQLAETLAL